MQLIAVLTMLGAASAAFNRLDPRGDPPRCDSFWTDVCESQEECQGRCGDTWNCDWYGPSGETGGPVDESQPKYCQYGGS